VSIPEVTPVTTPPVTVAFELVALQLPPVLVSVKVSLCPTHASESPVIAPIEGTELTVMGKEATEEPQLLVVVYLIVSMPVATAVTTPPLLTVAIPVAELLHVPPVAVQDKVVVEPCHGNCGNRYRSRSNTA
jgi:hypothetical protein